MKKIFNREDKPSVAEVEGAIELQSPVETTSFDRGAMEVKAKNAQALTSFKQLVKVSRSARHIFGAGAQWIQAASLFSPLYRDGLESPPFVITRAFPYESKEYGSRVGLEITLTNGRTYNVGLGLNDGDTKRNQLVEMFKDRSASPIGAMVFKCLSLGKGNDYYDIVPFNEDKIAAASIEIPFVEMEDDIPF